MLETQKNNDPAVPSKKVLGIAPYTILPALSGGQRGIFYFYQHLGKRVSLYVVSTDGNATDPQSEPLAFKLLPLLGSGVFRYMNPAHYFRLKALIKAEDIEAMIIEHPYMGWLGWLLKRATGIPLIVHSHNIEALRFKGLGKWWWRILADYERWVHKKASHSFFITREDVDYAVRTYGLPPDKVSVITYGMEGSQTLTPAEKRAAVTLYKKTHQIPEAKTLLLFNGIFGYAPNDEALTVLMEKIYPALLQSDPDFYLIVCGRNIPAAYQNRQTESMAVMGFVPDILEVFQAAEIFLNPIWLGGGIKTKLVEALAGGAAAVSFESGAIGVDPALLSGKLKTVPDGDITGFAKAIAAVRANI